MRAKEFFTELENNEDLKIKFKDVNGPEKFYEIAKENGLTDDFETMKAVAAELLKEAEGNETVDLSVLEEISGGDDFFRIANSLSAVFTSVAVGTLSSGI